MMWKDFGVFLTSDYNTHLLQIKVLNFRTMRIYYTLLVDPIEKGYMRRVEGTQYNGSRGFAEKGLPKNVELQVAVMVANMAVQAEAQKKQGVAPRPTNTLNVTRRAV